MTHKERIGWFLTLQQVVKRLKNRVAPPMPVLKRQSKLSDGGTLENALVILRQGMSLLDSSKILVPARITSLYYRDKVPTPISSNASVKSASSTPISMAKEYRTPLKTLQQSTKLDHRSFVTPTFGHDLKRHWARVEQLTDIRRLSPAMTAGFADFTKKAFAPGQAHPLLPLYVNGEPQKTTQLTDHSRIESIFSGRLSKMNRLDLEHPFPDNLNPVPVQKRETAVDQDQPSLGSNASASTVHLDGSSLGRWATQHLERVLSKPPSGITGVDPRATVPRSRVTPF